MWGNGCHSRNGNRRCGFIAVIEVGNRTQNLRRCPSRDAEVFQILIRQIGKDAEVNPVLVKTLRVLGQAELFEPIRNLLHTAPRVLSLAPTTARW